MSNSTRNVLAWVLQGLAALVFIGAGTTKLMHLSATVTSFSKLGLPGWLAYLVAGGEVLGGIGLLVPRFTRLAAACLLPIMLGAAFMHATKIPGGLLPNGIPSLAMLVILPTILMLRRPQPVVA